MNVGAVSPTQYSNFWNALRNPSLCTYFAHCLMAQIFLIENNVDSNVTISTVLKKLYEKEDIRALSKSSAPVDEASVDYELKQNMIMTLYYLTLFFNYDIGYDKHSFVAATLQNVQQERGTASIFMYNLCKVMPINFGEFNENIVGLIDQLSNLESHRGLLAFPPPPPVKMAHYSSTSFALHALRNFLYMGKHRNLVLESCNLYLKYPLITPGRVLSLLQLIRLCIFTCPYSYSHSGNINLLKESITRIKPYFLWPLPYGQIAKDHLVLISRELKCPGALLRSILYLERPHLNPNFTGIEDDGLSRRVHFLINKKATVGVAFHEVMQSYTPDEISDHQALVWILCQCFACVLPQQEILTVNLRGYTSQQLSGFLKQLEGVYAKTSAMLIDQALPYLQLEIRQIFAKVVMEKGANTDPNTSSPPVDASIYCQGLPPLDYEHILLRQERMDLAETLGQLNFPKLALSSTLETIIREHVQKNVNLLRFVVAGGDGTLLHVATAYLAIRQFQPELFNSLEVRFYVLPIGKENNFANFLATYDAWYGRSVLGAVYGLTHLLPVRTSGSDKVEKKLGRAVGSAQSLASSDLTTFVDKDNYSSATTQDLNAAGPVDANHLQRQDPNVVMRWALDSYLRDACHVLHVNVYQCETWSLIDNRTSYRTVALLQRVEIGAPVFKYKMDNNLLRDKKEKFTPPELCIKFTQMNCAGMARNTEPLDSRPYQSLSVVNVPRSSDKGLCACPTNSWLEMFTLEETKKKKSGKSENGQTHHVGYAEIRVEDRKKSFDLLIDGELFGPVFKIRISACKANESSEIITFPVATYFPMEF